MAIVDVDVSEVRRELGALASRSKNLRATAAVVAEMLVDAVEERVSSRGNGEWDGPAASTVERALRPGYRKGAGFGEMLRDTNHMVGDLQPRHDATSAEVASPAEYAGFHQEGTSNMPARDFLDVLDDDFLDDVADLLLKEIVR